MTQSKLSPTQLGSLVVMVIAIVVGWIAYHNYQPKLLDRYHLSHLSFFLVVAQGVILVITPPIAGYLGDRFRGNLGHRYRIISLGVGFAAMIFMTVALGLAVLPDNLVGILLPVLVIFWLVAMNIFTSPSISTFELFAPFEEQPVALAILTITAELLYALEPVIVPIIDALGGALTFLTGGVLVTVAGILLRRATRSVPDTVDATEGPEKTSWNEVLVAGVRLGVPTALVFTIWPTLLQSKITPVFANISGSWAVSGMLALAAIACLPLSKKAQKWGLQPSQRLAFTIGLIAAVGVLLIDSPILVMVALCVFALALSMQSVSALPYSLTRIASHQKVLGVGVFFAGVEIPNAMMEIWQATGGTKTLTAFLLQ